MILALTKQTFERYGEISATRHLSEEMLGMIGVERVQQTLSVSGGRFLMSLEKPVILHNIAGYAMLFVSGDNGLACVDAFPMEKPVLLNPGVYFHFKSLYGECEVVCHRDPGVKFQWIDASNTVLEPTLLPKITIGRVYTIVYQEWEKSRVFTGESHAFWELTYVDKGVLNSVADGVETVLEQGDLVFYGPNQFHTQYAQKNSPVCFITMSFDLELEEKLLLGRKFKLDSTMAGILEKILFEKEQNIHYSPDLVSCYLKEFVVLLIRSEKIGHTNRTLETAHKRKTENNLLDKAIEFIESNLTSHMTVSDVAAYLHISASYLSVLFRKYRQNTLLEYINMARLERCKELLREGSFSITEIAEKMGYSSVHYFSRQFKNYIGVSPTDYSKQIHWS